MTDTSWIWLSLILLWPNEVEVHSRKWKRPSGWSDMYSESASHFRRDSPKECQEQEKYSFPFGWTEIPGAFQECRKQLRKAKQRKHPLIGKDTQDIIQFYGYSCDIHEVTTDDGYNITLHRIPSKKGPSVLLWHGLGSSSDCWVFNGPTQSFAFILADLGYDVWLGNSRGSSYSLGHRKYSSDDARYWEFSWHENGMFDLPASIKLILEKNGNSSIFYVGHSQGTTNFMVGASTGPASNYLNKDIITAAFLLAPAGFFQRRGGANGEVTRLLADPNYGGMIQAAFKGRIQSKRKLEELSRLYLGNVCTPEATLCGVCSSLHLYLSGFNPPLVNYTNIPHLLDKYPNNIPIRSHRHYAQSVQSCKFRRFDFGPWKNKDYYGRETPPDYELKNINVPTYFYWGDGDTGCTPQAINRTRNAFRKSVVKGFIRVDFDNFNHGDFVVAKKVKELLYDQIVEEMKKLQPKERKDDSSEGE